MATQSQKSERLNLRVAAEDERLFASAAKAQRETMTQFLIESGRERAERLLADRRRFVISADEMAEMLEAMERPAQVRPELVELFKRARPE